MKRRTRERLRREKRRNARRRKRYNRVPPAFWEALTRPRPLSLPDSPLFPGLAQAIARFVRAVCFVVEEMKRRLDRFMVEHYPQAIA